MEWAEAKIRLIDGIVINRDYGLDSWAIAAMHDKESVRLIEDPMLGSFYISWPEKHQPEGLLLQIINIITAEAAQL